MCIVWLAKSAQEEEEVIIAVDAMGGDNAPKEIVLGCLQAIKRYQDILIYLVGDNREIQRFLPRKCPDRIIVVNTPLKIGMDEKAAAVRNRKYASVVLAATIAGPGLDTTIESFRKLGNSSLPIFLRAAGMVACGNTAVAMASAVLKIGRIETINRPALAAIFPGGSLLLDVGAVTDCRPDQLEQFALMGRAYMRRVEKKADPTVAILSIGGEKGKGNNLVDKASPVLKQRFGESFVGNVEGRDLFRDLADVIVTDGFDGNVALKTAEGGFDWIKDTIFKSWLLKILAIPALPLYMCLKKKIDHKEHGGAPLLGIDGVCVVGHGSSDAKAVCNAVGAARRTIESKLVEAIKAEIKEINKACT